MVRVSSNSSTDAPSARDMAMAKNRLNFQHISRGRGALACLWFSAVAQHDKSD
jgi:hypothetical protein